MKYQVMYNTFINGKEHFKGDEIELDNAENLLKHRVVEEIVELETKEVFLEVAPREEVMQTKLTKRVKK